MVRSEAAHALGLQNNRTLQLIIIPQALRVIVPPLVQPVSKPDQELVPRDRYWLHGYHGYFRRHQPDANR